MRVIAAILAGGSGSRVGGETPKQMLLLGGKPVLEHAVAAFDAHPGVDDVIVVCREDLIPVVQALVSCYPKVRAVIPGGSTRPESSIAAIRAASVLAGSRLESSFSADQAASVLADTSPDGLQLPPDASHLHPAAVLFPSDASQPRPDAFLLLHDAARPLVDAALIDSCLDALMHYDAVEPAIPIADTVVRVDGDGLLADIPPRSALRYVQTPQCFRLSVLAEAYRHAQADSALSLAPSLAASTQPVDDPSYGLDRRTTSPQSAHHPAPSSPPPALVSSAATVLTDDISVVRRYLPDVPIKVVDGSPRNLKLTVPSDLPLLEALLGAR